jgi:hypothetical protein
MKRLILTALFVFGLMPMAAQADIGFTTIKAENAKKMGQFYQLEAETPFTVTVSLPVEFSAIVIHRIPDAFEEFTPEVMPSQCKVLEKRDRTSPTNFSPFLIKCESPQDIMFSYSAQIERTNVPKRSDFAFTAGSFISNQLERSRFFERIRFHVIEPFEDEDEDVDADDDSDTDEDEEENEDDNDDRNDGVIILNPIKPRDRVINDPNTKLLVSGEENSDDFAIIGAFEFEPQREPALIRELTFIFENVDTSALYPDVADDFTVIDRVALFYQDGTSVKTISGQLAVTSAVNSSGEVWFNDLDAVIARGGEDLFIAVAVEPLSDNESGAAVRVRLSDDDNDYDIRGYTSRNRLSDAEVDLDDSVTPIFYVTESVLFAAESTEQPENLFSSRNELLKIDLDVPNRQEAILRKMHVDLQKSSGAGASGFDVKRLRLRQGGNIIASVSDNNLVGIIELTIGDCAVGDNCDVSETDGYEVSGQRTVVLEAEIEPIGGNLTGTNVLSARVAVNGNAPGFDGITWQDAGSGFDDGALFRWVFTDRSSQSYIENSIRTP